MLTLMVFVLAFAAIGVALLFQSHAQTSCTPTSNYVNPCRPWFGAAVGGNAGAADTQPAQFAYLETLIGHSMDIYRDYVQPPASDTAATKGDTAPLSGTLGKNEVAFAKEGKDLNINWNPGKQFKDAESQTDGGTAYVDSLINQAADNFVAFQKNYPNAKVFLTLWHEINLHTTVDTSSCSPKPVSSYGTSAQFIAAWQNVHNIFQAHGVHDVLWTLGYSSQTSSQCEIPIDWPGSQYVNWINYDTYDHGGKTWANTVGAFYNVLKDVPGSTGQQINAVPWGVGEFGTGQNTVESNVLKYYNDGAAGVTNNTYPNLKMYLIFADYVPHTNIGALTNYDSDGTLDSDKQAAVNNLVDAIYGSSAPVYPTPSVSITAPAADATVSGNVTVAAKASIASGASISSITLKANGATISSCSKVKTCSATWDTASLSNGTATLEADTKAADGKSASSTEKVTVSNVVAVTISAPTNITSPSQSTTSIKLNWSASQDSGYPVSKLTYHIYRNGAKVGNSTEGATTYTDGGLSPGTYYSYTITASDPAGNTSQQSAAFTQKTKIPPCAAPAAPQGLSGNATSPTAVNLSWQAVPPQSSQCSIAHYVVERDSVAVGQPAGTNYTDSGLTSSTTYTYSVLAVAAGNIGGAAATVHVTTPAPKQPDPGPTAPTHLAATAVSNTQINLSWTASTDAVTGIKQYDVFRNGTQVGSSTTTSFGDSGLQLHTAYSYKVEAVSGGGKTATSSTIQATTLDTTPPSVPGGVTSSSQTASSITLAWKASTDPAYASSALSYHVARAGAGVVGKVTGTPAYTDAGLSPGTTYSYTINASDPASNTSGTSKPFQATTKRICINAPAAPQGVSGKPASPTSIALRWQAVPPPSSTCTIAHYVVQRGGVPIASVKSLNYVDSNLTAATTYSYTVLAVTNDNTAGAASRAVSATTPHASDTTPPTAPAGLTAIAVNSSQIDLSWTASSDPQSGIKQYNVFRNGSQVGTISQAATHAVRTLSFGDTGLSANTSYQYKVVAINGVGLRADSPTVTGTTLTTSSPTIPGTGSSKNGASTPPVSPLLVGTKSVGAGSENGGSVSQNPTAATTGLSTVPVVQSHASTHGIHSGLTAYIVGGGVLVLFVGGGVGLRLFWRRRVSWPTNSDPDLYQNIAVGSDKKSPDDNKKENEP
jgi:chitodextrinase